MFVLQALLYITDALKRLEGQYVSIAEAKRLGFSDKSYIDEEKIKDWGKQLVLGLVMLEGSFPVGHLNPAMHAFVHVETARVGSAVWTSMSVFERSNKRMKAMVRSNEHPETSLANDIRDDIAERAADVDKYLEDSTAQPDIKLASRIAGGLYVPTKKQRYCLSLLGVRTAGPIQAFNVAWIRGVHFRCGEWGRRTCGSVFTTCYCGNSVYGILDKFLLVDGTEFAAVTWLSKPFYPYAPIMSVVRVHKTPVQSTHRCVIRCDTIEPCGICVMPDEDNTHFYMMRTKGYDRCTDLQ